VSTASEVRSRRLPLLGELGLTLDPAAFVSWLLPFALITTLAFQGGGYDPLVRGQVGIAVWWLVIVGVAVGAMPLRFGRLGWAGVAVLAAFLLWTVLGLTWTESTERTVAEAARVSTYLAFFVLALAAQGRAGTRHAVNGAACAIAIVGGVAVLSRLHPQWFGDIPLYRTLNGTQSRLSYPLNYWNLLACLAAMGVPLLFAAATTARTSIGRAVAAAAIPIQGLCVYLTVSRGGLVAVAVAVAVFYLLAPDRLPRLFLLTPVAIGTAVLCFAADRRNDVQHNLDTAARVTQGNELLGLILFVSLGVALCALAIALVDRHVTRPRWTRIGVAPARVGTLLATVLLVGAFLAGGGPGWAHDRFEDFKGVNTASTSVDDAFGRFASVTGNGRWDYWMSARRAVRGHALEGRGPGTFELYWARDGTLQGGYVRDAHSLWFQTLEETGYVGLVLVVALFLLVLAVGVWRSLTARDAEHRAALAAATAGVATFAVAASVEWAWQMTVLPAVVFVLAAVILRGVPDRGLTLERDVGPPPAPRAVPFRVGAVAVALVAVVGVAIPTAGVASVRASQAAARRGDLAKAVSKARDAERLQPYGTTGRLQEALVLERAGALDEAVVLARKTTKEEPTNWRLWFVRSRLEARTDHPAAALAAYRRARTLYPLGKVFHR
jgi:hypothetical protein